jgi:general secretion pathway protein G
MIRQNRRSFGFTLIELLAVIAILGLLFTLVAVNVTGILGRAKADITKTKIKQIEEALNLYHLRNNAYPRTDQGLASLVSDRLLKDENLTDAWKREFQYYCPSASGEGKYDIISGGSDGSYNTDDDITNHTIDKENTQPENPNP